MASAAWLDAVAADASTTAAGAALAAALDARFAGAAVRDVSLLPVPAACPAASFSSPADWAQAEHAALREDLAARWGQRLAGSLAGLLADADEEKDGLLLRLAGWPLTEDRDRELAYLAWYPELARIADPGCGRRCGRGHDAWVVVLHVPGFAAMHALVHDGVHLDVAAGPLIPAGTQPSPAQVNALLHADPGQDWPESAIPLARRVGDGGQWSDRGGGDR